MEFENAFAELVKVRTIHMGVFWERQNFEKLISGRVNKFKHVQKRLILFPLWDFCFKKESHRKLYAKNRI